LRDYKAEPRLVGRGLRVRAVARHRAVDLPAGVESVEADITDPVATRRANDGGEFEIRQIFDQPTSG